MNGWTVEWMSEAENDLADVWMRALDRPDVTAAQEQLDRLLGRDPLGIGEELGEGLRKLPVAPLKAYYSVDVPQHLVTISNVVRSL